MPKNKKRHASDGEDEAISPVVKKAKVKTPTKAASPSKPTPLPAKSTDKKSTDKKNTDKKNTDAEGNEFWEVGFFLSFLLFCFHLLTFPPQLGNKRRIGTSMFKNTPLINIREYYEVNGESKPGKKVESHPSTPQPSPTNPAARASPSPSTSTAPSSKPSPSSTRTCASQATRSLTPSRPPPHRSTVAPP